MMDLDEAWNWYVTTRKNLRSFGRLGKRYWEDLPWDGPLGKDNRFRDLESDKVVTDSNFSLEHLDDFAVLILFSTFESIIRDRVISDVQNEKSRLSHDLIIQIVDSAVVEIEHGSFHRVLETFKGRDKELVEEVNQVRKYRNWVAHGRRTAKPEEVDPETAFRRLLRFLEVLRISPNRTSQTN